jgi:hypothetical protein
MEGLSEEETSVDFSGMLEETLRNELFKQDCGLKIYGTCFSWWVSSVNPTHRR